MDDRLAGVAAAVVGASLAAVGLAEYVLGGAQPALAEPFATGALVVSAGVGLIVAGGLAARAGLDHLALRLSTAVALAGLALAVLAPGALLFGGVFWLGLVVAALVGAGVYRTARHLVLAGP